MGCGIDDKFDVGRVNEYETKKLGIFIVDTIKDASKRSIVFRRE